MEMFLPIPVITPELPVGEIIDEIKVTQTFVPTCPRQIAEIDLMMATYARQNTRSVIIRITDDLGNVVYEEIILATAIKNNDFYRMFVQIPVNKEMKPYTISITSPGSKPGDASTVWSAAQDIYSDGSAFVNGKELSGDLVFRYNCIQPVLELWFQPDGL